MKRKMPFIAALSILCWGCSSYDYSGDDIVGVKAAISGTITEVVEKSRTVGTTWTDGDRIGVRIHFHLRKRSLTILDSEFLL